jgi:hypothetical protein
MSKNYSSATLVIFLMLAFNLGCSIIPRLIPASMPPVEVANNLMAALGEGNYADAVELIENDGNKPPRSEVEKLKKKIESENLQPQSWILEAERIEDARSRGKKSYYVVKGRVIFKDGSSGLMRAELRAWGVRQNPWRFRGFELRR